MLTKLKAHFEFIRQKKDQGKYGIQRIRAVLVETLDTNWAEELRQAAMEIFSAPLFWFSASEIFAIEKPNSDGKRTAPLILRQPAVVLNKVWPNGETAA